MNIQALFPTPLVTGALPGSEMLCADLRRVILAREAENPGVQHSNNGAWQSDTDFLDWSGSAGAILINAISEVADHFTGVMADGKIARSRINWQVNAWANVNRAGHANDLHYHPGAYWSGVFYVDDGGIDGRDHLGGALEFSDPRGPMPLMHAPSVKMTISACASAGLGERFYPKTGMLALFPAWLGHSVTPYTGKGARISVAVNYGV